MKYAIELTDNQKEQMDLLSVVAHKHFGFNPKLEPIENSWESELEKHREQAYNKGFEDGKADVIYNPELIDGLKQVEYIRGLEDARQTLLNLLEVPSSEWKSVFDRDSYHVKAILTHYSISEIQSRIDAYKEKKKAEGKIRVGDEVETEGRYKAIVSYIYNRECADLIFSDGSTGKRKIEFLNKTGRNFGNEVEQLLDKMRGE